jgi:hypothetical protein
MYKTISNEIIRQFNPCYDPSEVIKDENEELPIKDWVQKYRKVVPAKDIIWLLLRKKFMSEKDLRLFAVWCAREALRLVEDPDHRSIEACDVAERYANGEAVTQEELLAARNAALNVVIDTVSIADAHNVAYYAAHAAVYASNAAISDDNVAVHTSHGADYAYEAAYVSDRANTYYVAQIDQLLTYF